MQFAYFRCPKCESTEVYRSRDSDRPIPICASCDESQSGLTEMVWIEDLTEMVWIEDTQSEQR